MIEEEETVAVRTPPMVPDRAIIEVPIHGLGFHTVFFVFTFVSHPKFFHVGLQYFHSAIPPGLSRSGGMADMMKHLN
jgi:hypothetical protein